jgi:hypothetical protein
MFGELAGVQRLGVALQHCEHEQRFRGAHRRERVMVAPQVGVALGLPERVAQRARLLGDPRLAPQRGVEPAGYAHGGPAGAHRRFSMSPASVRNRDGPAVSRPPRLIAWVR